ncbi:MAG: DUF2782 domain-containing protein [Thauera sp.]|jgi:hypothetical protein|nr:DUF2782 domain-containing protein [Thauera sp.]
MRHLLIASLLILPLHAFAQQPPALEPLPEPPPLLGEEALDEPQVTIIKRGEDTVTEYRLRGQLYMVKVTPPHGTPYYLIDQDGNGKMVRHDGSPQLSVPTWVLKSW